jgi:hypothetical protein
VSIEPAAQNDPRWSANAAAVTDFLDKVRRGDDLIPHLSIEPHTRGYAPAARAPGATPKDRWSDKDFLLNVMGYHHFHLGTALEKRGHAKRTNDPHHLIFAEVTRDTFKVIAIFDHDVFDQNSAERMRLWAAHEDIIFRSMPPGSFVLMGNTMTSGHSMRDVRYAQHCARIIKQYEPRLDDPEFVKSLYQPRSEAPSKSKLEWGFHASRSGYPRCI